MKGYALKKWESTLDLCVHAHGYDVQLVMKASCEDNYPLWCKFFCTYDPPFPFRVLPLWYLDGIVPLHHLLWIIAGAILLIDFSIPQVLGCRQPRTSNPFCFAIPLLDVIAIRWHSLGTSW